MKKLELLAPAKDFEHGKAAINHGADAVYIGAPRFSARQAAGTDIQQIRELVKYAHLYIAKVYIAFNTILFDDELAEAEKIIHQLYETGADAIIIQDMGIMEMSLPPIPLHASTQTHNHTPERVLFLEKCGFQRIILARELSLEQIRNIRQQCSLEMEAFIHGALCVSYSGQCYMSQTVCGRSGNRGVCAQPCRSAYDLTDGTGKILEKNKHLLSLKDLNLSENIESMAHAGITSFKIEGRLKDMSYLKNITAHYRQKLDQFLEQQPGYQKASSGKSIFNFTPDPEKTYNRTYTKYFIEGRQEKTGSFITQKSLGLKVGKILSVNKMGFTYTGLPLMAGDGLCFFKKSGELTGFFVNKANGDHIVPSDTSDVYAGADLYRNFDYSFENGIKQSNTVRKIQISLKLESNSDGFRLKVCDEDGIEAESIINGLTEEAKDPVHMLQVYEKQLTKLGSSPFALSEIRLMPENVYYLPMAAMNQLRRQVLDLLQEKRLAAFPSNHFTLPEQSCPYPEKTLDFHGNVSNRLAISFYKKHGVEKIDVAFELLPREDYSGKTLMQTKHCIRYQLNGCPRYHGKENKLPDPLFLKDRNHVYSLRFNCDICEMQVVLKE